MALVLQAWVLEAAAASLMPLAQLTVGEGCCYVMKMSPIETMCHKWCPPASNQHLLATHLAYSSQPNGK